MTVLVRSEAIVSCVVKSIKSDPFTFLLIAGFKNCHRFENPKGKGKGEG